MKSIWENANPPLFIIARQPILLNGISGIVTREDMLDRSIIIDLLPFENNGRYSERQLMRNFKNDLPFILGGIMDVLAEVIATYEPDSLFSSPRLIFMNTAITFVKQSKKVVAMSSVMNLIALCIVRRRNFVKMSN